MSQGRGGYVVLQRLRDDEWRVLGEVDRRPGLPARRYSALRLFGTCWDANPLRPTSSPSCHAVSGGSASIAERAGHRGVPLGLGSTHGAFPARTAWRIDPIVSCPDPLPAPSVTSAMLDDRKVTVTVHAIDQYGQRLDDRDNGATSRSRSSGTYATASRPETS